MQVVDGSGVQARSGNATIVIIAAALVISAAMGARQTFGLFLDSFAVDRGIPIAVFALAIALHNLVWGLAQPLAGAAADRYGTAPVVAAGALSYAAGLAIAAVIHSGITLVLGTGLLVGLSMSCTTFGVVLTAVGRSASPEKRSLAMGLASAGGSLCKCPRACCSTCCRRPKSMLRSPAPTPETPGPTTGPG